MAGPFNNWRAPMLLPPQVMAQPQDSIDVASRLKRSAFGSAMSEDPSGTFGSMQNFLSNASSPVDTMPTQGIPSAVRYSDMAPQEDEVGAFDVVKGILSAPFALLRGGKSMLEDVLGHRNSYIRQQNDAWANMAEQYAQQQDRAEQARLARTTPTQDQAILLGAEPAGRMLDTSSASETPAAGQQNAQPVAEGRTPGIAEWIANLGRDQRSERIAKLQAYMRMQAYDLRRRAGEATVYQRQASGDLMNEKMNAEATKRAILEAYGPLKEQANIARLQAAAGASNASAALSGGRLNEVNTLLPFKTGYLGAGIEQRNAATDLTRARTNEATTLLPPKLSLLAERLRTQQGQTANVGARTAATQAKTEQATGLLKPGTNQWWTRFLSADPAEKRKLIAAGNVSTQTTGGYDIPLLGNIFGDTTPVFDEESSETSEGEDLGVDADDSGDPGVAAAALSNQQFSVDDYDAMIPDDLDEAGAVDWLTTNRAMARKQAADIVRAIALKHRR